MLHGKPLTLVSMHSIIRDREVFAVLLLHQCGAHAKQAAVSGAFTRRALAGLVRCQQLKHCHDQSGSNKPVSA